MNDDTVSALIGALYQLLALGEDAKVRIASVEELLKDKYPADYKTFQEILRQKMGIAGTLGEDSMLEDLRTKLLRGQ